MQCVTGRSDTPLERYAKSLRQDKDKVREEFPMLFPMYTLPADAVLRMRTVKPHEELLAGGELSLFRDGMGKALFVSHQWVSKAHPDPDFKQFRVLQQALQNIFSGRSQISMDTITEAVFGLAKGISTSEFQKRELYLWYDYFSCPQDMHRSQDEVSENPQQRALAVFWLFVRTLIFQVSVAFLRLRLKTLLWGDVRSQLI